MTPEGIVKEEIKKILKRFKVYYFMPRGTTYGRRGIADITCCYYGRFIAVEAKADKRAKQSQMQKLDEAMVKAAGGIYILIHEGNLIELVNLLKRIKEDAEAERQDSSV